MYTIKEEYIKELELFIQEIPLKYGLPILNILREHLIKQEELVQESKKK